MTIENAVEYLKAKRQADGSFLYFADEVGEYYRVSQSDLDKLEEMQDYSLWCASYGESPSKLLTVFYLSAIFVLRGS